MKQDIITAAEARKFAALTELENAIRECLNAHALPDDPTPIPDVIVGEFVASAINVQFVGVPPFSLEIRAANMEGAGWASVPVNAGGYGDANIIPVPAAVPNGIEWRAQAASGTGAPSEYANGVIAPEVYTIAE